MNKRKKKINEFRSQKIENVSLEDNVITKKRRSEISWEQLPHELWIYIFCQINSLKDIFNLLRVSKLFKNLANEESVWRKLVEIYLSTKPIKVKESQSYKDFFKSNFPMLEKIKSTYSKGYWSTYHFALFNMAYFNLDIVFLSFLRKFHSDKQFSCWETAEFLDLFSGNKSCLNVLIEYAGIEKIKNELQYSTNALLNAIVHKSIESVKFLCELGVPAHKLVGVKMGGQKSAYLVSVEHGKFDVTTLLLKYLDYEARVTTVKELLTINHIYESDIQNIDKGLLLLLESTCITLTLDFIRSAVFLNCYETISYLLKNNLLTPDVLEKLPSLALEKQDVNLLKLLGKENIKDLSFFQMVNLFKLIDPKVRQSERKEEMLKRTQWIEDRLNKTSEVVDELVQAGHNVNAINESGLTILEEATLCGHFHLVAALLKHGAIVSDKAIELSKPSSIIRDMLQGAAFWQKKVFQEPTLKVINNSQLLKNNGFFNTSHQEDLSSTFALPEYSLNRCENGMQKGPTT